MASEQETFKNPIRAQLTTAQHKPCTYFATNSDGKRVFVKGPFVNLQAASFAQNVMEFKRMVRPNLSINDISLQEFIPDSMEDCQYGLRMDVVPDIPYWFQIQEDVLKHQEELPVKKMSSKKAWAKPVTGVDWSSMERYSHVEYSRSYPKSIYGTDHEAALEFVTHVFLSWICGAGPDLSFSNFIYDKENHTVFQVDNDKWFVTDWWIDDTKIGSKRSKAFTQFKKFVNDNLEECLKVLTEIKNTMITQETDLRELLGVLKYKTVRKRVQALIDDWETANDTWNDITVEISGTKRKVTFEEDLEEPPEEPPLKRQMAVPPDSPVEQVISTPEELPIPVLVRQQAISPVNMERLRDFETAIRMGKLENALVAFFECVDRKMMIDQLILIGMKHISVANYPLLFSIVKHAHSASDRVLAMYIHNLCISKKTHIHEYYYTAFSNGNRQLILNEKMIWNDKPITPKDPNFIRYAETDQEKAWSVIKYKLPTYVYDFWKNLRNVEDKKTVTKFGIMLIHYVYIGKIRNYNLNFPTCNIIELHNFDFTPYIENTIKIDLLKEVHPDKIHNEDISFKDYKLRNIYYKVN